MYRYRKLPILLLCILVSCYSYSTVRIVKRVDLSRIEESKKNKAPAGEKTPEEDTEKKFPWDGGAEAKNAKKHLYAVYVTKYFAAVRSFSPQAKINNRGVEHALRGELREAKILFQEAIREDERMGAACNNLAVIYEMTGNDEGAFAMYTRACLLEPDNKYFRSNFLYGVKDDIR